MGKIHDWKQYSTYITDCAIKKGLTTAKQLAHEAEVSEAMISKLKSDNAKSPSFDTVYSICEAAGASMDVMCGLKTDASEEVAKLKNELEEQKQINAELSHHNELLEVHLKDMDEQIKLLNSSRKTTGKWLTIVSVLLIVLSVLFIGLLIYDKLNPHMGWFRAASDFTTMLNSL